MLLLSRWIASSNFRRCVFLIERERGGRKNDREKEGGRGWEEGRQRERGGRGG